MPITLGGSARRRVVERDSGAGAVAGSAHGSIARARVVERVAGAGGGAGSAHGSIVVADRPGCAAAADGLSGATGLGDVAGGVGSVARGAAAGTDRVGALGGVGSFVGAGAATGGAFARAARAAGLLASKGGGSVVGLTWSEDGVEAGGPAVFAGGEIGSPLCACTGPTAAATRMAPAKMPARSPTWRPKMRLLIIRPTWAGKIRRPPLAIAFWPR